MAASTQGMWNQIPSNSAEPRSVSAQVNSTAVDSKSSGSSPSIAANDFLILLVTEMKNQDPTATTDPNEYVNQLVQVNSLQQLISINETLQKATSPDTNSIPSAKSSSGRMSPVPGTLYAAPGSSGSVVSRSPGLSDSKNAALQVATSLTRR